MLEKVLRPGRPCPMGTQSREREHTLYSYMYTSLWCIHIHVCMLWRVLPGGTDEQFVRVHTASDSAWTKQKISTKVRKKKRKRRAFPILIESMVLILNLTVFSSRALFLFIFFRKIMPIYKQQIIVDIFCAPNFYKTWEDECLTVARGSESVLHDHV